MVENAIEDLVSEIHSIQTQFQEAVSKKRKENAGMGGMGGNSAMNVYRTG